MTDIEVITEETKAKSLGGTIQFLQNATVAKFSDTEKAAQFYRWLRGRDNVSAGYSFENPAEVVYYRPSYVAKAKVTP